MNSIARPDHTSRPLEMTCEYIINADPSRVYNAWTERFDLWFAQKGTLQMVAEPGRPFFFYTPDEWEWFLNDNGYTGDFCYIAFQ